MLGNSDLFFEEIKKFMAKHNAKFNGYNCIKKELNQMNFSINYNLFIKSDIHSKSHCEIVAILSLLMAYRLGGIKEEDVNLLKIASLYHDIGRTNDTEDAFHGFASFKKLKDAGMLKNYSEEQCKIIQFLMAGHAWHDNKLKMLFQKIGINENQEKRIFDLLAILKDADAIDRLRLKDNLKFSFLRNKELCAELLKVDMVLNSIAICVDIIKNFKNQMQDSNCKALNLRNDFIYLTSPKFNVFQKLKKYLYVETFGVLKQFEGADISSIDTNELVYQYQKMMALQILKKDDENIKFYKKYFSKLLIPTSDVPMLQAYFQTILDRQFQTYYLDTVKEIASLLYSEEQSNGNLKLVNKSQKIYEKIIKIHKAFEEKNINPLSLKYEIEELNSALENVGSTKLCADLYDNRISARNYTRASIENACNHLNKMVQQSQLVEYDVEKCPENIKNLCKSKNIKIYDLDKSPLVNVFVHVSNTELPAYQDDYSFSKAKKFAEEWKTQGEKLKKKGFKMSLSIINKDFENTFFPPDLFLTFGFSNLKSNNVLFTMSADGWTINEDNSRNSTQVEESLSVEKLIEKAVKKSKKLKKDCFPEILYSLKNSSLMPDYIIAYGKLTEAHIKLSKAFGIPILLHENYKNSKKDITNAENGRSFQNICYEKTNYEFKDFSSSEYFFDTI